MPRPPVRERIEFHEAGLEPVDAHRFWLQASGNTPWPMEVAIERFTAGQTILGEAALYPPPASDPLWPQYEVVGYHHGEYDPTTDTAGRPYRVESLIGLLSEARGVELVGFGRSVRLAREDATA